MKKQLIMLATALVLAGSAQATDWASAAAAGRGALLMKCFKSMSLIQESQDAALVQHASLLGFVVGSGKTLQAGTTSNWDNTDKAKQCGAQAFEKVFLDSKEHEFWSYKMRQYCKEHPKNSMFFASVDVVFYAKEEFDSNFLSCIKQN